MCFDRDYHITLKTLEQYENFLKMTDIQHALKCYFVFWRAIVCPLC